MHGEANPLCLPAAPVSPRGETNPLCLPAALVNDLGWYCAWAAHLMNMCQHLSILMITKQDISVSWNTCRVDQKQNKNEHRASVSYIYIYRYIYIYNHGIQFVTWRKTIWADCRDTKYLSIDKFYRVALAAVS